MIDTADPQPILGAGVNQVQTVRDALCFAIAGEALRSQDEEEVVRWLIAEELADPRPGAPSAHPASLITTAVDDYRVRALKESFRAVTAISSSLQSPSTKSIGRKRSGASWNQAAMFCKTSALVRLLGAWEQFELDVLKALLYYRPHGNLGPIEEQLEETVAVEIISEEPRVQGGVEYYEKPALWTWIQKPAQGNDERRKIFERVFGLKMIPGTGKECKFNKELRNSANEKRNRIAHGRSAVEISLKEYLNVECLVLTSMMHLAQECRTKQKLII